MIDGRPGTDPWIFFTQARGGTWLNAMFLWNGDHLILLAVVSVGGPGLVRWAMLVTEIKEKAKPSHFKKRYSYRESLL